MVLDCQNMHAANKDIRLQEENLVCQYGNLNNEIQQGKPLHTNQAIS